MSQEIPKRIYCWIDRNILGLGREMRLSYLPPLMVYLAAGVSGSWAPNISMRFSPSHGR